MDDQHRDAAPVQRIDAMGQEKTSCQRRSPNETR
jgi:hypothetical protein